MVSDSTDLLRCKQLIEQKLDWGAVETWTSTDFENLQQRILDETGVSLSASTLRRIWGRVDYQHLPSTTTLNTLAQFAGYADWRQFVRSQETSVESPSQIAEPTESILAIPMKPSINWRRLGWMSGVVLVAVLLGVVAFEQKNPQVDATQYSFSSKPLTRTIPNSVIFTYDASASPTDSVYIQQSWDQTRREVVAKDGNTHTSIYYEPGFYRAKLVVGHEVVKEHSLLIPTNGWLGTIATKPVPIYLKSTDFIAQGQLRLPITAIQQKNVALQPEAPLVKYFNVGNFEPVPVTDFAFDCRVKNEYSEGSATCQVSWIVLMTNDMPISIPLCTKGCVSELMLMDGARTVLGKNTDLSGLGVDFSDWVHVACHSDGQKLYYTVNDKVAYSAALPAKKVEIIGLVYGFRGTGAVNDIRLRTKDKLVYQAF
ncbi:MULTISPECIES: hypothetical protein [unclassified Spirosoma]|uniref:hypothetical protein n=1 Tax=unclassified Spirosoma TaxID=2621999 RepID=UPI0009640D26|nr:MULTISPECIES: hypothetical protein [unclassified Spirosoma]MBN8820966.1 hypothetical protein [Spirosoma sp.]OJW75974.1 MAG: hypothetical protein BGO59_03850 [Spirosoma sp. 48-14]